MAASSQNNFEAADTCAKNVGDDEVAVRFTATALIPMTHLTAQPHDLTFRRGDQITASTASVLLSSP